jgi:hypothetical protein
VYLKKKKIMTTEQKQQENKAELANLALLGVAAGAWNILGEKGVGTLSSSMGNQILKVMEKEKGLKITGTDAEALLTEISRIFVEEYGFASDIEVEIEDDQNFHLNVKNCVNFDFTTQLMEAGVEHPFICPIMTSARSALQKMGYKMHENRTEWKEEKGSKIHFSGI